MNRDTAVRLVNNWIERYRLYLKDGGGSAGVHHVAKEALINAIADVFAQVPPALPVPALPEKPRGRGRPRKAPEVRDG